MKKYLIIVFILFNISVHSQKCNTINLNKIYNSINSINTEEQQKSLSYTVGFDVGFIGGNKTRYIDNFDTLINCKKFDLITKLIYSNIPETKFVSSNIVLRLDRNNIIKLTSSEKRKAKRNLWSMRKITIFYQDCCLDKRRIISWKFFDKYHIKEDMVDWINNIKNE